MALGLPLLGQLVKNVKYSDSQDIVKGAIDSVSSWAAGGSLQRIPDLSGVGNSNDFRGIVKSPSDAFGQPLVYVYDYNSSTLNSNQLCGIRTTSITLNYKVGTVSYNVSNVAFLVLSPGDDYKINSTLTASNFIGANNAAPVTYTNAAIPSPGGTANSPSVIVNADAANDIVQWVTIDELRTKIGCQGAQLTIVNNELPYGYNKTGYSAIIYATGGVPYVATTGGAGQYKWCIQSAQALPFANLTFTNDQGGAFNSTAFQQSPSGCTNNTGGWQQSDSIQIAGQPVVIVTGTDSNLYLCILSHVAASANRPISGASYATYWQLVTSSTPWTTWTSGTSYTNGMIVQGTDNNLYICILSNVAASSNQPVTGASYATYWQLLYSQWTSGSYYPAGSNELTIFVMDNGNNTSQKNFTFTVNPS